MFELLLAPTYDKLLPMTVETLSTADFISGTGLASQIGLNIGNVMNNDTDWFKFTDRQTGQIKIIPKLPLRNDLNHGQASLRNPADESVRVTIQGEQYKIRLMTGATENPTAETFFAGGEYNDLFYSICSGRPANWTGPILANFTPAELGFQQVNAFKVYCINRYMNTNHYFYRGTSSNFRSINHENTVQGSSTAGAWRPILIKV